jgi:hypothetical protein
VYWHLDKFAGIFRGKVDTGRGVPVQASDVIGSSGKTGFVVGTPHLHFEVRHNGRQVDPYGWYGPDADPCAAYAACEASTWLWSRDLAGEFDFTPPDAPAPPDRTPPVATLTVAPQADLLFLARFDQMPLQQVGAGAPSIAGAPVYADTPFGRGLRLPAGTSVSYPIAGNLRLEAGTIAFWAQLPEHYPSSATARNYLIAASAHADEGPVYSGTLALRRDLLGPNGAARWDFWTTPESGAADRDDLAAPDTLARGLHHFAISWDRAARQKALYLDGVLAVAVTGVSLPTDVGAALELGRWTPGSGVSGATFDELAIFGRALTPAEIAHLAASRAPLPAGAARVGDRDLRLDANALDDAGGIMGVQLGINGVFGDPQPYEDSYKLSLPSATGVYTVAARFFDRAGNSTTVSSTVALAPLSQPIITLEHVTQLRATLVFSPTGTAERIEMQASATPDFSAAAWQPLPERRPWTWAPEAAQVVWVRFRSADGLVSAPLAVGPDAQRVYLPSVAGS